MLPAIDPALEKILLILVGAVLTWLLQQYRIARAEDVALINEHIKDLEKFRDAGQEYWLKKPGTPEEDFALAAKVRAAHAATTLLYVDMNAACYDHGEEYKQLSLDLFKAATGGDFESEKRAIEAERAINISDLTARIIHLLRRSRKDMLSLKRLGRSLIPRVDFGA